MSKVPNPAMQLLRDVAMFRTNHENNNLECWGSAETIVLEVAAEMAQLQAKILLLRPPPKKNADEVSMWGDGPDDEGFRAGETSELLMKKIQSIRKKSQEQSSEFWANLQKSLGELAKKTIKSFDEQERFEQNMENWVEFEVEN